MANNIFDLFNVDFSELNRKFNELTDYLEEKYNNFVENNIKKYDLNTEEGYEAFIKEAAELRKELENSNSFFAPKMLSVLDSVVEKAMNKHNNNKKNVVTEIVNNEVNREMKENNKVNTCNNVTTFNNEDFGEPEEWPSDRLTYRQSRSIRKLVDEYMEVMIEPYIPNNTDNKMLDDMASGLYEFAAWLLMKEDE